MRHAFWLINSTLLLLTLVMVGFMFFSQQRPAEREDIEPKIITKTPVTAISKVNIQKIYEDDLFGTYQKEFPAPAQSPLSSLPEAPLPHPTLIPEEPKPEFLEPLAISLKGIIAVLTDESKNRAIIEDTRTSQEKAYKVGDKLEDAQLIRIFNNKVLFLRSNGQQEVLYLREKDAKSDPLYASIENWSSTLKQTGPFSFAVNTNEFVQRVPTLGQIIDMLDLTTVYKQGESVGMRVGQIATDSLGVALGLQKGDIITTINDIPTTTTTLRFQAYQKILTLKSGDVVTVELYRYGRPVKINYTLKEVTSVSGVAQTEQMARASDQIIKEQIRHLEKKHTFAPTLQEIREQEKKIMLERGKRPTKNVLSQLNE